jgi:exonuclease SbcD
VDHVPAGVFAGADYVALGHLHGPQHLTGPEGTVLRYSGSPLAYSFSEQHHAKSTVLVDLSGPSVRTELVAAPVPRRLADVTGTLDELLADGRHADDWVRVTVTDAHRPQDLFRRVRAHYPHALVVQHVAAVVPGRPRPSVVTTAHDPLEVAADFVTHVTGHGPTRAEVAVLRQAYEDVADVDVEKSA